MVRFCHFVDYMPQHNLIYFEGKSARDYMVTKIERKILRASKNQYLSGDEKSCVKQLKLLDKYWIPELDKAPFVLVHSDLSADNIIVDDQYDVQR